MKYYFDRGRLIESTEDNVSPDAVELTPLQLVLYVFIKTYGYVEIKIELEHIGSMLRGDY